MTGPTHYVDGVHPVTLITTTRDGSTALVQAAGSTDRQTVPMARLSPIPTHHTDREAPTMTSETSIDISAELIDTVTDHYLLAGLWCDATDDNGDEVTDAHIRWSPPDVGNGDRARERVAAFLAEVRPAPEAWAIITTNPEQAGHDLWLSAGGHGAGFWDRGHGLTGDYLHTAAQLGSASILVSEDGPEYEAL